MTAFAVSHDPSCEIEPTSLIVSPYVVVASSSNVTVTEVTEAQDDEDVIVVDVTSVVVAVVDALPFLLVSKNVRILCC